MQINSNLTICSGVVTSVLRVDPFRWEGPRHPGLASYWPHGGSPACDVILKFQRSSAAAVVCVGHWGAAAQ